MVWNWFKVLLIYYLKVKGDKVDKHVHVFSNELTFVLSGEMNWLLTKG
jgi:quercetin dioxygenase-like cupin family protein